MPSISASNDKILIKLMVESEHFEPGLESDGTLHARHFKSGTNILQYKGTLNTESCEPGPKKNAFVNIDDLLPIISKLSKKISSASICHTPTKTALKICEHDKTNTYIFEKAEDLYVGLFDFDRTCIVQAVNIFDCINDFLKVKNDDPLIISTKDDTISFSYKKNSVTIITTFLCIDVHQRSEKKELLIKINKKEIDKLDNIFTLIYLSDAHIQISFTTNAICFGSDLGFGQLAFLVAGI